MSEPPKNFLNIGYDGLTTSSALPIPSIQDIMESIVAARKTQTADPRPGDFSTSYSRPLNGESWKHLNWLGPMTTPEQEQLRRNLKTFLVYCP